MSTFPAQSLSLMPPREGVRGPDDDWKGITDAKERRRRQNRVHQRTYRKRQAKPAPLPPSTTYPSHPAPATGVSPGSETPNPGWIRVSKYMADSPIPPSLPLVIRLNICNALTYNAHALGLRVDLLCDPNYTSPFLNREHVTTETDLPLALRPTNLQKTTRHSPWIDMLPLPRMRDNLIRACRLIDERDVGSDILTAGGVSDERATLLVWGDPSDPRSWEASVAFLHKWGYLLKGCQELIEATNYWRSKRGEGIFRVDVS